MLRNLPDELIDGTNVCCFSELSGTKIKLMTSWMSILWINVTVGEKEWCPLAKQNDQSLPSAKTINGPTLCPPCAIVKDRQLAIPLEFLAGPKDLTGDMQSRFHLMINLYHEKRGAAGASKVPLYFHSPNHREVNGMVQEIHTIGRTAVFESTCENITTLSYRQAVLNR